jgi:hypothetical protein
MAVFGCIAPAGWHVGVAQEASCVLSEYAERHPAQGLSYNLACYRAAHREHNLLRNIQMSETPSEEPVTLEIFTDFV